MNNFDLGSFALGAGLSAVAAYATGFLQEWGKETFSFVRRKIVKTPPDKERVPKEFVPSTYVPGDCAWVREERVFDKLAEGWTNYPGPAQGGPAYRRTPDGNVELVEFLLVKPGAARVVHQEE